MPAWSLHLVFILSSFFKRQSMVSCAFFLLLNKKLYPHYHPLLHGPWIWSSFHIKNTIHCADSIMSACHSVMSVCHSAFNFVRLSFNYVFLPFNYSCPVVIQLLYLIMPAWHSIMFDIIFQLLLFVIKLSLVIESFNYNCLSMQFLTLWTSMNYGLLRFNYSISIQYRLTACTWARKSTADYWLTSSGRLLRAFLARGLKMASKEFQDVSDSNGKGESYQRA